MIENQVTFLILCPELNTGGLLSTFNSIKGSYPDSPCLCVVGNNATAQDVKEFATICPIVKAGGTITSLINLGVKKTNTKYCYVIMAGCLVRNTILKKYDVFLKDEKDILYSVVDRSAWLFPDATINGMLLGKHIMQEVGDFSDDHGIMESKLLWAGNAIAHGYKLKGIVGTKL
jgi:hypothetical protein